MSLEMEDASHAPWEQVALAAVTFAFLLIRSGVKRWRDGGGNVQRSKLNPDVGRNLLKDKSGEALLLNAKGASIMMTWIISFRGCTSKLK
jgi:hypothetical protein